MPEPDLADFDGCSRQACWPRNKPRKHTLAWGDCAHATEHEPRINIGPRPYLAADGEMSIGYDTYTVTELADKVEAALRTVPIRLGPNALTILQAGGTVGLSGGEYGAMALEVVNMLQGSGE